MDNLTKLIELKAQKKILEQLQSNLQAEKEKAKKLLTEARQNRLDLEDVDTRGMSDEEKVIIDYSSIRTFLPRINAISSEKLR